MYVHTLQITSYGTAHMCFIRDVTLRARLYIAAYDTLCVGRKSKFTVRN